MVVLRGVVVGVRFGRMWFPTFHLSKSLYLYNTYQTYMVYKKFNLDLLAYYYEKYVLSFTVLMGVRLLPVPLLIDNLHNRLIDLLWLNQLIGIYQRHFWLLFVLFDLGQRYTQSLMFCHEACLAPNLIRLFYYLTFLYIKVVNKVYMNYNLKL